MDHYRHVTRYFPRQKKFRDCDTVTFFPTAIHLPEIKLIDFLCQAASDIISILTWPPSTITPNMAACDLVRNVLLT